MANIPMKTLKLHGLDQVYEFVDPAAVAPSGYGYGEPCISLYHTGDNSITALEEHLDEIVAGMNDGEAKQILFTCTGIASTTFYGTVYQHTASYVVVTGKTYFQNGSIVKCKFGGKWEQHAWENPPMELGVEYRTTERWNGKAVYTALLNLGYGPNSGTFDINTNLVATQAIRATARISGGGVNQSVPYENNTEAVSVSGFANAQAQLFASLRTNFNATAKVVWAQFWYIKE